MSTHDTQGHPTPDESDWKAGLDTSEPQTNQGKRSETPNVGPFFDQAQENQDNPELAELRQRTVNLERQNQVDIDNLRANLQLPTNERPPANVQLEEKLKGSIMLARQKRARELAAHLNNPAISAAERAKYETLSAVNTLEIEKGQKRRADRQAKFRPLLEEGIIRGLKSQITYAEKKLNAFSGTNEQRQKLQQSLDTAKYRLYELTRPEETATPEELTTPEPEMSADLPEDGPYIIPDSTPVPQRTAEEIALAKKIDIKADLTELLNVTLDIPELDQVLFNDETLEDLLDRGYRPGDGRLNLQAIVSVLDGKLHIAEEVLDVEFPGVQFENGQPQVGLLGRLFGKKKKILASADYQNFKMLYDFKNELFAQFETMDTVDEPEPDTVEPNTTIIRDEPIQIKKRNPLLRYATAATAAAALAGDHNDRAAVSTQTESAEKTYVIPGQDSEEASRRPTGMPEVYIAPAQANSETAAFRRDLETRAQKYSAAEPKITKNPPVAHTNEEANAQPRRDLEIVSARSLDESPTSQPRRDLEKSFTPEATAQKLVRKPIDVSELIKKFTYSEPNAVVKNKTETAFAGSANFIPLADQTTTRLNQYPAAPSSGAKAIPRFAPEQTAAPSSRKMSVDFTPVEPSEQMDEEEVATAFTGGPTIDFQADGKIFDQGPKKPDSKVRAKPSSAKKIKTQFNLDENPQLNSLLKKQLDPNMPRLTVSARAEAAVAPAESINPTTRRALSQRFKKVGLSTPEQTALLSHVTKLSQNLTPDAQARKLAKILQMNHKELKKMIDSIPR
ncbi:MAG: hypothetical protein KAZ30_01545 [Candidatus Magasanikbacteria bacterium]|nr:hypothetical protein [Candidatus Magasanikbacteria bacterium]